MASTLRTMRMALTRAASTPLEQGLRGQTVLRRGGQLRENLRRSKPVLDTPSNTCSWYAAAGICLHIVATGAWHTICQIYWGFEA